MTGAQLFRLARRRSGLSQRELAARSGVSASTVARIEAGAADPSMTVLSAVLRVAGLELSVDVRAEASEALLLHLRHSLPARLHLLLGGNGVAVTLPPLREQQLELFTATGELTLIGPCAAGLWLPAIPPPSRLTVLREPFDRIISLRPVLTPDWLDVVDVEQLPVGRIDADLVLGRLSVLSPAELALDPACARYRSMLRAAAQALHDDNKRDDAGRRSRAHLEPRHSREVERTRLTKRYGSLRDPGPTTCARGGSELR